MRSPLLRSKLPHISLCFPSGFSFRSVVLHLSLVLVIKPHPEVDIPTKYGLVYEDLALHTEDGITLRSYLLLQRKEISHTHALQVEWTEEQSNEDVRFLNLALALVMFTTPCGIVCGDTTDRHHVPWQWR